MSTNQDLFSFNANKIFRDPAFLRDTNYFFFETDKHNDEGKLWNLTKKYVKSLEGDWVFDMTKEYHGNCEDWDDLYGFNITIDKKK
jgi:hypothetical protein